MDNALAMSNHDVAVLILAAARADPSGYGRIPRKSGDNAAAHIDASQLTPDPRELNEINSSIYCFAAATLWPALAHVKTINKHREIYLTDAVSVLNSSG